MLLIKGPFILIDVLNEYAVPDVAPLAEVVFSTGQISAAHHLD